MTYCRALVLRISFRSRCSKEERKWWYRVSVAVLVGGRACVFGGSVHQAPWSSEGTVLGLIVVLLPNYGIFSSISILGNFRWEWRAPVILSGIARSPYGIMLTTRKKGCWGAGLDILADKSGDVMDF